MNAQLRVKKTIEGNLFVFVIFSIIPLILIYLVSKHSFAAIEIQSYFSGSNLLKTIIALCLFFTGASFEFIYMSKARNLSRIKIEWTKDNLTLLKGLDGKNYYDEKTIDEYLNYNNEDQNFVKLAGYYTSSTMVRAACFLACSGIGYLMAKREENASYLIPFLALTYIGLIAAYPSFQRLKKMTILVQQ